jgi:hypothetical protein
MTRSKKGFEVPLLDLLRGPIAPLIDELVNKDDVEAAGLDWSTVREVLNVLRSNTPGTSQATVHALLVYLSWHRNHGQ